MAIENPVDCPIFFGPPIVWRWTHGAMGLNAYKGVDKYVAIAIGYRVIYPDWDEIIDLELGAKHMIGW